MPQNATGCYTPFDIYSLVFELKAELESKQRDDVEQQLYALYISILDFAANDIASTEQSCKILADLQRFLADNSNIPQVADLQYIAADFALAADEVGPAMLLFNKLDSQSYLSDGYATRKQICVTRLPGYIAKSLERQALYLENLINQIFTDAIKFKTHTNDSGCVIRAADTIALTTLLKLHLQQNWYKFERPEQYYDICTQLAKSLGAALEYRVVRKSRLETTQGTLHALRQRKASKPKLKPELEISDMPGLQSGLISLIQNFDTGAVTCKIALTPII